MDHHCHPLRRWPLTVTDIDLRAIFTEATDPAVIADHVPATAAYHDGLRRLGSVLACEPTEAAVLEARAGWDPAELANHLLDASGTGALLLDFGFATADSFSALEHAQVLHVPQREVVRLEVVAEGLLLDAADPDAWLASVRSALRTRVGAGAVGIKTIAAYRAGLRLRRCPADELNREFSRLKAAAGRRGTVRLEGSPLCHTLLFEAAAECRDLRVPLQVHCGLGDPDEDLAEASPLGLRPLLVGSQYQGLSLVLLHCWPYHREAAYMCAVYPHVYMDLSLALPLAGLDGRRAMRETLGLCPWSKLLYASDASRIPEYYFIAASVHREALAHAFADMVESAIMDLTVAASAGRQVLSGNARRLYRL